MPRPATSIHIKRPAGWRRAFVRLSILLLCAYSMYGCALVSLQDRLIFPRDVPGKRDPAAALPAGWEQLTVKGEDGSAVPAWLNLPAGRAEGERVGAVMWFHGNAEVIDDNARSPEVEMYPRHGLAVLVAEYRGYGRAGGAPSQEAITADSVKMYDLLAARPEIDPAKIVFYGRSLGGGVRLAAQRKPAALILQSSFTSLSAMAARFWVPWFLVRHPFRNDHVVETLDIPILIMHGTKDDIIPFSHGEALAKLARHGTFVTQECRHNDFPTDFKAYERDILAFLSRTIEK